MSRESIFNEDVTAQQLSSVASFAFSTSMMNIFCAMSLRNSPIKKEQLVKQMEEEFSERGKKNNKTN
jgi:hypothetical protein